MNVIRISEATAHDLAKKNEVVFMKNATPAEYITYTEVATLNLGADTYTEVEITEEERKTYSLITYHYISYNESSYPVRYETKPFLEKDITP
ncbi:MAG: hypothetical protein V4581_02655 [Bacteroidota bacterium]